MISRLAVCLFVLVGCRPLDLPVPSRRAPSYEERVLAPAPGPQLPLHASLAISALSEATFVDGALYAASPAGVIVFVDPLDLATAPLVIGPRDGVPSPAVASLARVGREVWAATDRGIARIDPRTHTVTGVWLVGERVHQIVDGVAVTPRGLVRPSDGHVLQSAVDARVATHCGGRWLLGGVNGIERVLALPVNALRCRGGVALAATPLGVYAIDRARVHRLEAGHATTIDVGRRVLVGTLERGVHVLGQEGTSTGRAFLIASSGDLTATLVDRTLTVGRTKRVLGGPRGLVTTLAHDGDALWVGTFDDGLYRLDRNGYAPIELPDARVTSLTLRHDALWIGTATGLLALRAGHVTPVVDPRGWLRRYIGAIRVDGERVRVAAFPGVVEMEADAVRYVSGKSDEPGTEPPIFGTTVTGMATIAGHMWLSTLDGLQILGASTQVIASVGGALPDDWVNDVLGIGDDTWFLLGDRGLGRVVGNRVTVWRAPLASTQATLTRIGDELAFIASGALYVARLQPDGSLTALRFDVPTQLDTLDYDAATDRLWLGGPGGVSRLDHATSALALPSIPSLLSEVTP